MFRRPNVIVNAPTRTEYVTKEIHEHRAPTDASVKLLSEMEAKAQERIVQAVHVGDSAFECVIHARKNHLDGSTTLLAIFSLRGRKMEAEFTAQDWRCDKLQMAEGLRAAIADKISREILIPALQGFRL